MKDMQKSKDDNTLNTHPFSTFSPTFLQRLNSNKGRNVFFKLMVHLSTAQQSPKSD